MDLPSLAAIRPSPGPSPITIHISAAVAGTVVASVIGITKQSVAGSTATSTICTHTEASGRDEARDNLLAEVELGAKLW